MSPSPIDRFLKPVHRFIHQEYTGAIILLLSVLVALVWANSSAQDSYHLFWEQKFSIQFASYVLTHPLHVWINDGLMALFFFVIGLELKREFMAGELSTIKKAALPMMAALGGMLLPATIFLFLNYNSGGVKGWGIPMATDIAFALGLLSLAGRHIPASIKVFLSALAVADDLGAVLVIAFFYTVQIDFLMLAIGLSFLGMVGLGNLLGIRNILFYLVVGLAVWLCFLLSGVHATIAGVLVAFMIPARTKINELQFAENLRQKIRKFEEEIPLNSTLTTHGQHQSIEQIKRLCLDAETPLQKIEHSLHPWVSFGIMPLFALANAGILLNGNLIQSLLSPVSLGVSIGLLLGKFMGVLLFTWVMVKFKFSVLPVGANWHHIIGVSLLAGVGFTMSLFITDLAFNNEIFINQAKSGILITSLVAGLAGIIVLRKSKYSRN